MSDTPESDKAFKPFYKPPWRVGLRGLAELIMHARRLERQRDAYAETLREILAMDPDWTVIAKRHPELASGSGEGSTK